MTGSLKMGIIVYFLTLFCIVLQVHDEKEARSPSQRTGVSLTGREKSGEIEG